jgi:peptidoglycan/LPS O-acetylase OafA/YrhL
MNSINKQRAEINGLRGIAVLAVVLFHLDCTWTQGGFVGVDIFFVISGYLITQLIIQDLEQGAFRFTEFWLRRARRLLPALSCVVFFAFIMSWLLFLPDDFKSFGRSLLSLAFFSSNLYFWLKTGYFTAPAETKPLLHTWTLAVEEQFYLLFPLLLYVVTRYFQPFRRYIVLVLGLFSFILTFYMISSHQLAAFFLLPTRAWELLVGSLIALGIFREGYKISQRNNEIISFVCILAIGFSIFFYNHNTLFPGMAALLPCLGVAGIIITNQKQLTRVGRGLTAKPLVMIGLISYSWYLWHWVFIVFLKYVSDNTITLFQTILIFVFSFFIAWLSYIFIENPIRQKKVLIQSKTMLIFSLFVLGFAVLAGIIIDITNGVPNRLKPSILAIYNEAFYHPSVCENVTISKNVTVCSNNIKAEKPDLVLWGDSHANALLPLIQKLAAQHHFTFWYYACIPVLDVYKVDESTSLKKSHCYASNHEMMSIIQEKHIKHVLLASFWTQFTKGREMLIEGAGQRDPFYADELIQSTSSKEAELVFKKHFTMTINQLNNTGAMVWIMRQVPTHRYWVANQLAKALKYGEDPNRIGRPLKDYVKRQQFMNSYFDNIANNRVRLISPDAVLCHQEFCYGSQKGHALYFDFNHLSTYGALTLEPIFISLASALENG